MATAYTGNGPYCYSNSLHMCLTQAGMAAVPPVSLLECRTGMPFGARRMVEKGEAYGEAQYHAVRREWVRTGDVFDRLARIESRFAPAL